MHACVVWLNVIRCLRRSPGTHHNEPIPHWAHYEPDFTCPFMQTHSCFSSGVHDSLVAYIRTKWAVVILWWRNIKERLRWVEVCWLQYFAEGVCYLQWSDLKWIIMIFGHFYTQNNTKTQEAKMYWCRFMHKESVSILMWIVIQYDNNATILWVTED